MIKTVSLRFVKGLTSIRGPNEGGKSTILEGIAYALYGAKALRNGLGEVVTWGHKEIELSSTVVLEVGGHTYTYCRSKAGAEIHRDDEDEPFVTGQNEVTAFTSELLNADQKTAERLMFAKQSKLADALKEGPTAIAAQIEALCDFDVFDTIIGKMQEKLLLGVPTVLESNLKRAEEKLAEVPAPVKVDTKALQASFDRLTAMAADEAEKLPKLKETAKATFAAFQNAENAARMHQTIKTNLGKHERDLAVHTEQLKAMEAKIAKRPKLEELAEAKAALAAAKDAVARKKAYDEMTRLMATYPAQFWEGTAEELAKDIATVRQEVDSLRSQVNDQNTIKKVAAAKIVTSSACPTCGQDVSQSPKVKENNAEQQRIIDLAEATLKKLSATLSEKQNNLIVMEHLRDSAGPFNKAAQSAGVIADYNFVPPRLSWDGPTPTDGNQTEELQNRLVSLEEREDTARRAEGQAEVVRTQIHDDRRAIEVAGQQLTQYPAVENIDGLREAANEASGEVSACEATINRLRDELAEAKQQIDQAESEYRKAVTARQSLEAEVAKAKADLETLHYNNALLKKIRAIRPLVADQLWNQVLAAVSGMFSQMRGEDSVVTKGKDGFRVNGYAVESYSGSALDLLGLSIRVALMKTFLPSCPFLILDEPMAACSDERSAALLGFVASCGFEQIILVTHEEASESVADQLIELS
jgi:DNA repair exonuclease SbcCD ATPase subunit